MITESCLSTSQGQAKASAQIINCWRTMNTRSFQLASTGPFGEVAKFCELACLWRTATMYIIPLVIL